MSKPQLSAILWQMQARRWPEAELLARQWLAAEPEQGLAHKSLAVILAEQGQADAAIALLETAAALLVDDAECHRNLGLLLMRRTEADLARAAHEFRRVLALAADDVVAQGSLARVLMLQGELPQAVNQYRCCLQQRLTQPRLAQPKLAPQPLDQRANEALLWQVLAGLAQIGVHAFACSGSLLGLVRDGQLLACDKDLDISAPFAELDRAASWLTQNGWQRTVNPMQLINPLEFVHRSGMLLDLCGVQWDAASQRLLGGFWRAGLPWQWQRVIEYPPLSLQQQASRAGWVWALSQPEPWLTALYGDWRTPDPDFDSVIAAYNLCGYSLLTQCYALHRINSQWQQGQLHKTLALTRQVLYHCPQDNLLQQICAYLAQS